MSKVINKKQKSKKLEIRCSCIMLRRALTVKIGKDNTFKQYFEAHTHNNIENWNELWHKIDKAILLDNHAV